MHPFSPLEYTTFEALRGHLVRGRQGRVLRHRGPQRVGQDDAAEAAREHLPGRSRADPGRRHAWRRSSSSASGFNPNLTARENVLLNGVMMGLTPREARRRFDEVIEFAELEEFVELKLKNYSSGMTVRLAFSVMVQSDADMMLIDEVLAVGDASFAQKCVDIFHADARRGQDDRPRHPRHGEPADALRPGDPDRGRGDRARAATPEDVGATLPPAQLRRQRRVRRPISRPGEPAYPTSMPG